MGAFYGPNIFLGGNFGHLPEGWTGPAEPSGRDKEAQETGLAAQFGSKADVLNATNGTSTLQQDRVQRCCSLAISC